MLDSWLVADALEQLTPEHRAVVVGAYYGGRSVAELAREHQIPEGTVKSRMHYALRALRLALQERGVPHDRPRPGRPRPTGEDPFREWDAAYVLGALDPADRRAFEDHLRTCDACRAAVAELAGMPGLLRMVPADEADRARRCSAGRGRRAGHRGAGRAPGPAAAARRAWRASRRPCSCSAGWRACSSGGRPAAPQAAAPSSSTQVTALRLEPVGTAAVSAELTLEEKRWGTRIDWECRYPSEAALYGTVPTYELVLVDDDGTSTVVATWSGGSAGARGLGASSSIVTDTIRRVEIRVEGSDTALAAAQT